MAAKNSEKAVKKAASKKKDGKSARKAGEDRSVIEKALAKKIAKRREKIAGLEAEIAEFEAALTAQTGRDPKVSPLAPATFSALPPIAGLRLNAINSGIKYKSRPDVMLAELAEGSVMAGAFTRSETRAAPVLWCQERLAAMGAQTGGARLGIVVNAGNANAFTGDNGMSSVATVMEAAGDALGVPAAQMFMASTGVIGEPLPHEKITGRLNGMVKDLAEDGLADAARAIMTTDTFPKGASRVVDLGGETVTISGIAKGSGMIAPDMATMLVFIFTDCAIAQPLLQKAVSRKTGETFNAITVDSDTSTSDTLLVAATGKAAMKPIETARDRRLRLFEAALGDLMRELALLVVRDGEGATKLVEVNVTGAKSARAARLIGLAIANSPLVKTAIAGEDPNWGRVVMAVGKSGQAADRDKLAIRFGGMPVAEAGWVSPDYSEAECARYMKGDEIQIQVDVGVGKGEATVWTCDLTKRYIEINADYRS